MCWARGLGRGIGRSCFGFGGFAEGFGIEKFGLCVKFFISFLRKGRIRDEELQKKNLFFAGILFCYCDYAKCGLGGGDAGRSFFGFGNFEFA